MLGHVTYEIIRVEMLSPFIHSIATGSNSSTYSRVYEHTRWLTPFLRRMTAVRSFPRIVDAIANDLPARSGIRYSHVIELVGTILHLFAAHTHHGRMVSIGLWSVDRQVSWGVDGPVLSTFTRRATHADWYAEIAGNAARPYRSSHFAWTGRARARLWLARYVGSEHAGEASERAGEKRAAATWRGRTRSRRARSVRSAACRSSPVVTRRGSIFMNFRSR